MPLAWRHLRHPTLGSDLSEVSADVTASQRLTLEAIRLVTRLHSCVCVCVCAACSVRHFHFICCASFDDYNYNYLVRDNSDSTDACTCRPERILLHFFHLLRV